MITFEIEKDKTGKSLKVRYKEGEKLTQIILKDGAKTIFINLTKTEIQLLHNHLNTIEDAISEVKIKEMDNDLTEEDE